MVNKKFLHCTIKKHIVFDYFLGDKEFCTRVCQQCVDKYGIEYMLTSICDMFAGPCGVNGCNNPAVYTFYEIQEATVVPIIKVNTFHANEVTGDVSWIYHDPILAKSNEYLCNFLSAKNILEIAETAKNVDDFFSLLNKQAIRFNAETIAEVDCTLEKNQGDYVGRNPETLLNLVKFAMRANKISLENRKE